jgi:hypothetical protein
MQDATKLVGFEVKSLVSFENNFNTSIRLGDGKALNISASAPLVRVVA